MERVVVEVARDRVEDILEGPVSAVAFALDLRHLAAGSSAGGGALVFDLPPLHPRY